MKNLTPGETANSNTRLRLFISIIAGFLWLCTLAVLAHWARAAFNGRLAPGEQSSWFNLASLFVVLCVIAFGGCYLTVRAWTGKSNLKWQALSAIAALLFLWMVSGD